MQETRVCLDVDGLAAVVGDEGVDRGELGVRVDVELARAALQD